MTEKEDKKLQTRLAKRIADLGYCSRREAEKLIADKKVKVNDQLIDTPVYFVSQKDEITIDNNKLVNKKKTLSLYAYYKPCGLVCSTADEKNRRTIFDDIKSNYPNLSRLIYVGRLDLNSEGILLLTNSGELSKLLSAPDLGLVKTYKVRAFGKVIQNDLDKLAEGVTIEDTRYRPIVANILKSNSKHNMWLEFKITEGKNREIRKVCEYLGLQVNRLIRTSFGPFNLLDMQESEIIELDLKKVINKFSKSIQSQITSLM